MLRLENIKIKKLRAFAAAAEGYSPAELLGVTYRTSCRYIQEVEILYGYKLFYGARRPSNLTNEGIRLLSYVKKIIKELDRLECETNRKRK